MEQKITIAKMRSAYCKQVEKDHRSLSNYLREINSDFDNYSAKVPAATARAKESYSFFAAFGMKKENLSLAYIKKWFSGIDTQGRICDFKKVELSEESEIRAKYPDYDLQDCTTFSKLLIPVSLWTASKVLVKVAAAVKAEKAAASAAAAAVREQQKADKERKEMERLAEKLAAYKAKQAAAAEQTTAASKSRSKSSKSSKSSTTAAAAA